VAYEFRKIYADIVTAEGDLCVMYLTWVCLAGRWYPSAGVETYWADGRREVHRSPTPPGPIGRDTPLHELPSELALPGGVFEVSREPIHGGWDPEGPIESLRWSVVSARSWVQAHHPAASRPGITGDGYVDWVSLTRYTRFLGLKELRWGRVHLPGRTLVFNTLEQASGETWRAVREWTEGSTREWSSFELELDGELGRLEIPGEPCIELEPLRVLHEGSAFDAERIPSPLERAVVWAIGGPHWEKRRIGRAVSHGERARGWAVYETVRFGEFARQDPD